MLAVLIVSATFLAAAVPKPEAPPEPTWLAGQLLVASSEMGDPRFYHAVILMVQHDAGGAIGIMINRAVGERSLADLLAAIGEKNAGVEGHVLVFAGGPVGSNIGFVIHSADYHRAESFDIDGRVAMTSSPEVLRDIASNRGPKKSLVAFGYAGWGPGQLEDELAHHVWFTIPEDPKLVFDEDREKIWDGAMARRTFPL